MPAALYGHAVVSDVPLPRLRHGDAPRGELRVRRADGPLPSDRGAVVAQIGDEFSVRRDPDGPLTMWCRWTGTYALDASTLTATVDPAGATEHGFEHRLACVAIPLMLAERGDLALHASAVAVDGVAVAFLGLSGSGKSTTAWALGTRGHEVLAEDGCVVTGGEQPVVWPGLAGVRLLGDGGKRPHHVGADPSPAPVPLVALVLLGPRGGSEPALARAAPEDAILATMPNTVHAQGRTLPTTFRAVAQLTRGAAVFHGTLPDDLERVPEHADALLARALADARPAR